MSYQDRQAAGHRAGLALATRSSNQDDETVDGRRLSSIALDRAGVRGRLIRLFRYGATSAVALAISEVTLLVLYATGVTGATTAAIIANLAGTVPSYLLSRFWIWPESDRRRVGRQVVLYWTTSAISMTVTSVATGAIAASAPHGHTLHVAIVGVGFVAVNFVLWIAKYVVYQHVIFKNGHGSGELAAVRVIPEGADPASAFS